MATTVTLVPTNEVSNRLQIASTTTWKLCPEAPALGTSITTSVASTSTNTTNWFQVTPGATNSTGQASLPTTPNGKGWICELDYTSAGGTGLQNATQNIKLHLAAGTGCTFTVDVMCWVLTLPSSRPATSITSQSQIGSTVSVTGITSSTTNPVTFSLVPGAAFALGANQYLYFEVWVKQTVSGTTHTLTVSANLGNNGEGWAAELDDSGTLINGTTNFGESYQWNDKVGFYRNKWGMVKAIKDTANAVTVAATNGVPNTALANASCIEFQITAGASPAIQNTEFVTTAGAKTETINNPVCQSIKIAGTGYSSSAYVSQITTWFGMPLAIFTQFWGSATSVNFTNMACRYANSSTVTAGTVNNTSNGTTATNFAQSTSGAGVNGWGYTTGASSTAGMCIIPDRHRATAQLFAYVDSGTNVGTSNNNSIPDATTNATATSWGGRELVYVDATANITSGNKDKYLNNYNKNLNGPPTTANSRLVISTGTVKSDSDSAGSQTSILSGFDYETMAYRITASANTVVAKLVALASYALPFRCFIIESYTAATAPVVATSSDNVTFTALDSGVTSNGGTLYKGTNYASYVDTVAQVAYVAIFGEQAANATTYYKIIDSMSTAYTQTLTDTITPTDAITKQAGPVKSDTITPTDAIIKFPQYMCPAGSCTITTSDVANKSFTKSPFAETVTPTDTATKKPGLVKADTLTPTDTATKSTGKNVSDTLTPSDTKFFSVVKGAFAETLTGTDAAIKSFVKGIFAETLTLTDAITKKPAKALADTLTPTAALGPFAVIKSLADTLTGSDTASKSVSKPLSDTITPTSAQTTKPGKVTADTVTPSDVATKSVSKGALTDTITPSDAITKTPGKSLAETVTATAAMGPFAAAKLLVDTLTGTDTKAMAFTKAPMTDTINPVDAGRFMSVVKGAFAETLTPSDAQIKDITKGTFAESITVSQTSFVMSVIKNLTESLTISESGFVFSVIKALADSLTLSSSVGTSLSGQLAINLNETMTLTAAIIKDFVRAAFTETITPTDTTSKLFRLRALLETLTATDSIATLLSHNFSQILNETLTATDARIFSIAKKLNDTLTLTDAGFFGIVHAYFQTLTESLTLTDATFIAKVVTRLLTELANVRNLATRDFTEGAEILLFVDRQFTEVADILKNATRTLIEKSNVSGLTGRNFTEKANVYALLAQTLTEQSNIYQILYATLKETAGVLNTLATTLTEKSNTAQLVTDTLTELANVAQLAGKNLTELSNASQHMAQTLTEKASINGISTFLITTNNTILGLLARDFTSRTQFFQLAAQTLTEKANAAQLTTKLLTEKASTYTTAGLSKSFVMSILMNASQTLTTKTTFFQLATKNLSEIGGVANIVAQTLTETVNMAQAVADTLTESASINATAAKSLTELANASQLAGKNTTTITNFLLTINQNLTSPSRVMGLVGRSNTTLANFIAHVGTNLQEPSNILANLQRDFTTKQNVLVLASQVLTEVANGAGSAGRSLSSYMTISRPAAKTLTSTASLLTPELGRLFHISEIINGLVIAERESDYAINEQAPTLVISETAFYTITPIEIKE